MRWAVQKPTTVIRVGREEVVAALRQQLNETIRRRRDLLSELQRLRARRQQILRDGIGGDWDREQYAQNCRSLADQRQGLKHLTRMLTFLLGALRGRTKVQMCPDLWSSKKSGVYSPHWAPYASHHGPNPLGPLTVRLPIAPGGPTKEACDIGAEFWRYGTELKVRGEHVEIVEYVVVYQKEVVFLRPELSVVLNTAFREWMRYPDKSLSDVVGFNLHQTSVWRGE